MIMTFPNETAEYRKARNELLAKEIELRRTAEAVAKARRALPKGGKVPADYIFEERLQDGKIKQVKLSELFNDKSNTLAIYSYMFGATSKEPCSMCTPILDGLDGVYDHIQQRLSFIVVAEASAEKLHKFAEERGWSLRLLSTAGNPYNNDYHGKDKKGNSDTMLNVFHRDDNGDIYHFWGTEIRETPSDPGQDHRAIDNLSPIFQFFDLTPEGRGDWYTKLRYD
jgi:predicted dithiol-disulfide oxidoreductase (DUF899 family)